MRIIFSKNKCETNITTRFITVAIFCTFYLKIIFQINGNRYLVGVLIHKFTLSSSEKKSYIFCFPQKKG